MAPCQNESTFSTTRTLPMVVSSRAPSAAPQTVPMPPVMATPPTTTALTTVSSQPCALSATTVPKRASHRAPAKPGDGPGEGVRGEHPAADRDAGETGGLGAGADRVELAPGAVAAQEVRRRGEQDDRDQRQVRDAEHAAAAEAQHGVRHVGGADLLALRPPVVDALDDVEHAEGHDERRDPAEADEQRR